MRADRGLKRSDWSARRQTAFKIRHARSLNKHEGRNHTRAISSAMEEFLVQSSTRARPILKTKVDVSVTRFATCDDANTSRCPVRSRVDIGDGEARDSRQETSAAW